MHQCTGTWREQDVNVRPVMNNNNNNNNKTNNHERVDVIRRRTSEIVVDGQKWDLSNLCSPTKSSLSLKKHLYPKIDDEDAKEAERAVAKKDIVREDEHTFVKRRPPASMKLRSNNTNDHPEARGKGGKEDKDKPEKLDKFRTSYENDNAAGSEQPQQPKRQTSEAFSTTESSSSSFAADFEDEDPLLLEVAPGLEVRLRGSAETRRAIRKWEIVRVNCLECTVQLHCINNAEYLLCPLCRCVSPLRIVMELAPDAHGVGLGFQSCPGRRRA